MCESYDNSLINWMVDEDKPVTTFTFRELCCNTFDSGENSSTSQSSLW